MSTYGQFCPIAKAMEVLDERWTLLVVRELLLGSRHFNELRRGNPRMSPALLSKRLRRLERVGVVARTTSGGRSAYELTESGRELRPVVDALGAWGARWVGGLGEEDLDPHLLFWDIRRTLPVDQWPRGHTVLAVQLGDVAAPVSRWWVCVDGAEVDVCDVDPGHEVVATLRTSLRAMTEIWRGDRSWSAALRSGSVVVDGPRESQASVPRWLGQSLLASVPRPA